MSRVKTVKGGGWEMGAISNAVWTGVPLKDVLLYAGLNEEGEGLKHVQFTGNWIHTTTKLESYHRQAE